MNILIGVVLSSNGATLLALVRVLMKLNRFHSRMMLEHELLVRDYCERHKILPDDLPSRMETLKIL